MVWSGRSVSYKLSGIGLSGGDRVKIVDGEAYMGCTLEGVGRGGNIQGGREATLGDVGAVGATFETARVELRFDLPSTHARFCYMYR